MAIREIIFRGKRVDNGEWVVSDSFYQCHGRIKLWDEQNRDGYVEVEKETVGQYTGLTDKNGKKIFEGDIIHIKAGHGNCIVGKAIVYFDEKLLQYRVREIKPYAYDSEDGDLYRDCDFEHIDIYEVIGNIHDNKELLGE